MSLPCNLIGKRFSRLLVVRKCEYSNKKGSLIWECLCDCGNITTADSYSLNSGKKKSCGCLVKDKIGKLNFKDLSGQVFGKLTVIKYAGNSKWVCECECGNKTTVYTGHLQTGHTSSCGCNHKNRGPYTNLIGKRYGRLTVKKCIGKNSGGNFTWECICDCGNVVIVPGGRLQSGKTTSCGCYSKELVIDRCLLDITGERFGRLVAISYVGNSMWLCNCDCGGDCIANTQNLKNGHVKSCGCFREENSSALGIEMAKYGFYLSKYKWYFEFNGHKIPCRSSYEVIFANYLIDNCISFEYEPEVFKLSESMHYIPDFYLPGDRCYVEIKGWEHGRQKVKRDIFQNTHNLILYGWKDLKKIVGIKFNPDWIMEHAKRSKCGVEDWYANRKYLEI